MGRLGRCILNGLAGLAAGSFVLFAAAWLASVVAPLEVTLPSGHVVTVRDRWVHVVRGSRGGGFGLTQWVAGCGVATVVAGTGWLAARRRGRPQPGRCPACGYDLRATPDRCPECGKVPACGARGGTSSTD